MPHLLRIHAAFLLAVPRMRRTLFHFPHPRRILAAFLLSCVITRAEPTTPQEIAREILAHLLDPAMWAVVAAKQ